MHIGGSTLTPRGGAGTGLRGALKMRCSFGACGFESHPPHAQRPEVGGGFENRLYYFRVTSPVRRVSVLAGLAALLLAAGCGSAERVVAAAPAPSCPRAWKAGWQRLA